MDKKEFHTLLRGFSEQLKESIPKGASSLMFTADGEGGVFCHIMGRRADILTTLCAVLEQNKEAFEIVVMAAKICELKHEIDSDLESVFKDLISELRKSNKKESTEASSGKDADADNGSQV